MFCSGVYSDQFKKEIRGALLTFLDKYQDNVFRPQINDILKAISTTDFPVHYPELFEYFLNNMNGLMEALKDEQLLLSDITMNFLKTLKIVITERSRKKMGDSRNIFLNVYFKLMEGFHGFWDYFHVNLKNIAAAANQQNMKQIERFIRLSRKADKTYIALLCNGCDEMVEK